MKDVIFMYESYFYKNELKKILKTIKGKCRNKCFTDRTYFTLERQLFNLFYYVRKMIECKKVKSEATNLLLKAKRFQIKKNKIAHSLNNLHYEKIYDVDLNNGDEEIKIGDLCNMFIHAYICSFIHDENNLLKYIAVTSWNNRNKYIILLHFVEIEKIVTIFSNSYPDKFELVWNDTRKDYDLIDL